jgi:hypothetical protein
MEVIQLEFFTRQVQPTDVVEYLLNTFARLGAGFTPHQAFFFCILLCFLFGYLPSGSQVGLITANSNDNRRVGLSLKLPDPCLRFLERCLLDVSASSINIFVELAYRLRYIINDYCAVGVSIIHWGQGLSPLSRRIDHISGKNLVTLLTGSIPDMCLRIQTSKCNI